MRRDADELAEHRREARRDRRVNDAVDQATKITAAALVRAMRASVLEFGDLPVVVTLRRGSDPAARYEIVTVNVTAGGNVELVVGE